MHPPTSCYHFKGGMRLFAMLGACICGCRVHHACGSSITNAHGHVTAASSNTWKLQPQGRLLHCPMVPASTQTHQSQRSLTWCCVGNVQPRAPGVAYSAHCALQHNVTLTQHLLYQAHSLASSTGSGSSPSRHQEPVGNSLPMPTPRHRPCILTGYLSNGNLSTDVQTSSTEHLVLCR